MKSIKLKLFLSFTVFMIMVVLLGILLNSLFLKRYFIFKNESIFEETASKIQEIYLNNKDDISDFITNIDRVDGINCIITDKDIRIMYISYPIKTDAETTRLPKEIENIAMENRSSLSNSNVYKLIDNQTDQAPKLVYLKQMPSGELIVLTKALKNISDSVAIANQFYILAGLLIILTAGVVIYFFSRKISRSVIQMSVVAESISNLDFTKQVKVTSNDEFGKLAESINKISVELSKSTNELKSDIDRRKELVRNMSHELKSPIAVIKGYADGLKYGVTDDEIKMQNYCNIIAEECDRMDGIVRELLELSLMESGSFQLKIENIYVKSFIESVVERFAPDFAEKKIDFKVKLENINYMTADKNLIDKVLNNFISNALNHVQGDMIIRLIAEKKEDHIRLSVFNSGSAIANDQLDKIWDPFYKIDKARTRQYGGHGLGLSIVKSIAQLHKGTCGVENLLEGVVFFIDIPQNF